MNWLLLSLTTMSSKEDALDLSAAHIHLAPPVTAMGQAAASMLQREVLRRIGIVLPIESAAGSAPAIVLRSHSSDEVDWSSTRREGYSIVANASGAFVSGQDGRGLLFGTGRLIRILRLELAQNYYTPRVASAKIGLPVQLSSAPSKAMRGVQVGYRPKTNSYDGLTPELFEQLVVDLVLFGVNQIELIPHSFDDAPYSPHFALSHADMNVAMSSVLAKYGINCSLWFPACHPGGDPNKGCETGNYRDKKVMAAAVADWHRVFSSMPRLDTLFINAGDPGGQSPDDLMMIGKMARAVLKRHHPHAQLWICPQDYNESDYRRWAEIAATADAATFLDGIIYGPGMPLPLADFASSTAPARYPVRLYPDITHSLGSQLPVPNWDPAFHFTENRETVNPRPLQEGAIAAHELALADAGVSSYNEGHHDDVNKHVWLASAWGCDDGGGGGGACDGPGLVRSALRDWSALHFDPSIAEDVTELVYALERDWVGPLVGNPQINVTFSLLHKILAAMPVRVRWSWRAQQLMYRANYDKFLQVRATLLQLGEVKALAVLRATAPVDPERAMAEAAAELDAADTEALRAGAELHIQLRILAEAVFQSIHEQFSVPLYGAEYTRRGANLDLADIPLSNAPYLRLAFERIGAMRDKNAQSAALQRLAGWTDAGPGGFYDDLGRVGAQPHYLHSPWPENGDQAVHASPVADGDSPSSQYYQIPGKAAQLGKKSLSPPSLPKNVSLGQLTWIETTRALTHRLSIRLRYPSLPPKTKYAIAVACLDDERVVTVTANGKVVIRGAPKLDGDGLWKLDIPEQLTMAGGNLTVAFESDAGFKLCEAWLRVRGV